MIQKLLWIIATTFMLASCRDDGGCKQSVEYYESFSGPGIPRRPKQAVTLEEAVSRGTYVIGRCDSQRRPTELVGVRNGKAAWWHLYEYANDSVQLAKTADLVSGKGTEYRYASDGKVSSERSLSAAEVAQLPLPLQVDPSQER